MKITFDDAEEKNWFMVKMGKHTSCPASFGFRDVPGCPVDGKSELLGMCARCWENVLADVTEVKG